MRSRFYAWVVCINARSIARDRMHSNARISDYVNVRMKVRINVCINVRANVRRIDGNIRIYVRINVRVNAHCNVRINVRMDGCTFSRAHQCAHW